MPIYDYQCRACEAVQERYAKIDQLELQCELCAAPCDRIFSSSYVIHGPPDFVTADISGEPVQIHSRQQLDRLCKEHGVSPKYGKGWK